MGEQYACPKCGYKTDDIDNFKSASDIARSEGGAEYYCPKCDAKLTADEIELEEMTTSGSIAFAPQMGFRDPTPAELAIIKGQPSARQKKIKEAVDSKIPQLKSAISTEIHKIITKSQLSINDFIKQISTSSDITPTNVLVRATKYIDDVKAIEKLLPDDMGELELILSALQDQELINKFDVFSSYTKLYGARIAASLYGTKLIYEGYVDIGYKPSESLYIADVDLLDKAGDMQGVKVAGKVVYPVGGIFPKGFFADLKDVASEEEEEKETSDEA